MKKVFFYSLIILSAVGVLGLAQQYSPDFSFLTHGEPDQLTAKGSALLAPLADQSEVRGPSDFAEKEIYKDWPVYYSDFFDFSLRYPSTWAVLTSGAKLLNTDSQKPLAVFFRENEEIFMVDVLAASANESLDNLAQSFVDKNNIVASGEMIIDGYRALELSVYSKDGASLRSNYILVRLDSQNILRFRFSGIDQGKVLEKVINSIDIK